MYLKLIFENSSSEAFQNFAIKLNANAFKLQVTDFNITQIPILRPGEVCEVKQKLQAENMEAAL